jgi:hypothetical protein
VKDVEHVLEQSLRNFLPASTDFIFTRPATYEEKDVWERANISISALILFVMDPHRPPLTKNDIQATSAIFNVHPALKAAIRII